jgi:hypothetical protein
MNTPKRWQTGLVSLLFAGCSALSGCGPKSDENFTGTIFGRPSLEQWDSYLTNDGFLDSNEIKKMANIYFGEHAHGFSTGNPHEPIPEGEYTLKEVGPRKGYDYEISINWRGDEYRFYGKGDLSEARLEKYEPKDN